MFKSPKIHIYITAIAVLLIIIGSVYSSVGLRVKPHMDAATVEKTDITQGVRVDGTVKAAQDLNLAFVQGGTVSKINVKAGDSVKKGQILAELDSKGLSASLSQVSAAVQGSEAAYEKILNGATDQDINIAKVALANAKTSLNNANSQQQVAVDNAYKTLLNSGLAAIPDSGNSGPVTVSIFGAYTGQDQGSYKITIFSTGNGLRFQYDGLETGSGIVDITPKPLGSKGLYIQFSATSVPTNNSWTVSLPNTQAASYVANYNAYQSALQNKQTAISAAQSAVDSAQAALDLKQTKARPEDVAAAQAQLNASRAQYQLAQNSYSQSILTAPIDGIITSVDAKVGQTVAGSTLAPGIPAIKMMSDQKFQIETFVAETDIGKIKVGDIAQVALDAYGDSANFPAIVITIDPATTIIKGISTYKATLQFNQEDQRILAGMGASVTIIDEKHAQVLAIPGSSVLKDNGKTFVLVDMGQSNFKKTKITAGITGIEGKAEVLSGLSEGQKVIYFGN